MAVKKELLVTNEPASRADCRPSTHDIRASMNWLVLNAEIRRLAGDKPLSDGEALAEVGLTRDQLQEKTDG